MAKLAIDVVLNKASAMTGLRGMEKDFVSFGKSMLGVVGIGGGLAGLVAGIDNILAKAGQLQDVSDAFNISAESIQRLGAVGVTANLSIEEIGSKLGKLGKAAQEAAGGNIQLASSFAKIGVTGQDLVSLNPEELFNKLREAVSSGALAGEELKIVNELLAKDFQRFLPLLRMTSEEYNRLGGASGVMSDATVSSLDAMNVKLRQFQNTAATATSQVAAGFLDLATELKESPLKFSLDILTGDYEKIEQRIAEREKKLTEVIKKERSQRAGTEKIVQDEKKIEDEKKAFDKSEEAASRHEQKLNEVTIQSKEEAEKMKAAIEEKYHQRSLDRADELMRKRAGLVPELQDLEAERGGSEAQLALLEERARTAANKARTSGMIEDVTAAQRAAVELQRANERDLSSRGFGKTAASEAAMATENIVGQLPSSSQFRDMPTEVERTQPVRLVDPPNLQGIMDKLDELIKNAGVFS
jgi:myosin heavy subunit